MAQRISRAKQRIKAAGARFDLPPPAERASGSRVVLHVLYLVFNEGYTATSGPELVRAELTRRGDPADPRAARAGARRRRGGRAAGACMLLTDARRPARTAPDGSLVPLAEQDRTLWDREPSPRASRSSPTPCRAARSARTSSRPPSPPSTTRPPPPRTPTGRRSSPSTRLLERVAPNPMVTLNRAVAVAMVQGPAAGLALLDAARPTSASPPPTASCPCGPTCWRWPATTTRRAPATARRTTHPRAALPGARRAAPGTEDLVRPGLIGRARRR